MAEVKVRITAQNETQTGFQAVLNDAKKTAAQVQQTMSASTAPAPAQRAQAKPFEIGDVLADNARKSYDAQRGALEDMLGELRRVREGSQQAFDPAPPQQFGNGLAGVLARFALIVGGAAAVGKIIASAFGEANAAVKEAIETQKQFNNALQDAGQATNIGSAVSEFRQLNAIAEQTGRTLETSFGKTFGEALANVFQGRPGQLLGRIGSLALGNAPIREIQQNQEQQRQLSLQSLDSSLNRQISNLQDVAATGGDGDAAEVLRIQQERAAQLERLVNALQKAGVSDDAIQGRIAKFNQAAALEDKIGADQKRLESEREITKERERQAAIAEREAEREAKRIALEQERIAKRRGEFDQEIALKDAKLKGDKKAEENILQQQDMARVLEAGGSFEQAANMASLNALERQIQAQQAINQDMGFQGSSGASAFQRVGLATNEFFDTRKAKDPAEAIIAGNKILDEIKNALKKAEPLVLNPTST
jgi:hypothetical protein